MRFIWVFPLCEMQEGEPVCRRSLRVTTSRILPIPLCGGLLCAMPKKKPDPKKKVFLQLRVEPEIKDSFFAACKRKHINASDMIRAWIEDWTKKNSENPENGGGQE